MRFSECGCFAENSARINAVYIRRKIMFCRKCGSELPEGTGVCPNCGRVNRVKPPVSASSLNRKARRKSCRQKRLLVKIGAAAAMIAGYIFLVLSIISLGKRQKFSSSCKKSAVSLGCFLASFALTYLAIFLINSKISDKIYFDLSLFGVNILFYIFAAGAAAGIILSWCYKRRTKA